MPLFGFFGHYRLNMVPQMVLSWLFNDKQKPQAASITKC